MQENTTQEDTIDLAGEEELIVLVKTSILLKHCPIFKETPWNCGHLSKKMVLDAVAEGRLNAQPYSLAKNPDGWSAKDHAERIAFFVTNPIEFVVDIDVGVPFLGCNVSWFIQDGNHQFAAAVLRGEDTVQAKVSGDINYANDVLKANIPNE